VRTVRDLLKIALREVKIYSPQLSTDDEAFGDAFNFYVDMINEFESQGIESGFYTPSDPSDSVGNALISVTEMAYLLMTRIASYFDHELTRNQMGNADRAESHLMSMQKVKMMKKNYVPTGFGWYNRYAVSCCDNECSKDDPCCEGCTHELQ
jgi:hypothetical protein